MITAYINEPLWNFRFPHTSANSPAELAQAAYTKFYQNIPLPVRNAKPDEKITTLPQIVDYDRNFMSDMYIPQARSDSAQADVSKVVNMHLPQILAVSVADSQKGTLFNIKAPVAQVPFTIQGMLKKELVVLVRPKLYDVLDHNIAALLKHTHKEHATTLEETLANVCAARSVCTDMSEMANQLQLLMAFISLSTMEKYALVLRGTSRTDFSKIAPLINYSSYYPYRFGVDKTTGINEFSSFMQLINDVCDIPTVDGILTKRFGIDRKQIIQDKLDAI